VDLERGLLDAGRELPERQLDQPAGAVLVALVVLERGRRELERGGLGD